MFAKRSPTAEDDRLQAAMLTLLLLEHPAGLSIAEVATALREDRSASGRDRIERAANELAAHGLANRQGELVIASRSAVRFDHLLFS
jgi:hypothetical protein